MEHIDVLLSYTFWIGAAASFVAGLYAGARLAVAGVR
jgi:hypothetical protein